MRLRRTLGALAAIALLLAAGCSDDDPTAADDAGHDAGHNAADVSFATQMIPHHDQALRMVAMTEGRDLSPDFEQLTSHIHDAQQPEIETMTAWLEEWGEDVPSGHAHHHGMDMSGLEGTAGMMSEEDLADLDAAAPSTFEQMWLRMMIEHHEGAIEMARTEIAEGEYGPAVDLAESIVESQTHEIEEMRAMLGAA